MNIEKEIRDLKDRNKQVELNKGWEISYTRRIILLILTYLAVGAYLAAIQIENPWQSAIVPAVAFMLSTLTLPFFKAIWSRLQN
ncbi:MAG: hypothetical protein ABII07_06015 [Patescibacteria group bacterium]|nr:hypothetical protein [Patescibacteria group bacterium]